MTRPTRLHMAYGKGRPASANPQALTSFPLARGSPSNPVVRCPLFRRQYDIHQQHLPNLYCKHGVTLPGFSRDSSRVSYVLLR